MPWIIAFARFWSSNMDLVHAMGQSWPGFSHTDSEKAEMHRIARSTGGLEFLVVTLLVVLATILFAAACIGVMFWRLQVKYGSDPARTPGSEFFLYLAVAMVTSLAGGMPLAIMLACWIASHLFHPSRESWPDERFSRELFGKSARQIVRMGILATLACVVLWAFVPQGSKLDTFLHVIVPCLAPTTTVLSSLYYYSGRTKVPQK